jgi:hypothetical protein
MYINFAALCRQDNEGDTTPKNTVVAMTGCKFSESRVASFGLAGMLIIDIDANTALPVFIFLH